MKSLFLVLVSLVSFNVYNLSNLFGSKANKTSISNKSQVHHSTNNCEIKSWDIENSDYKDGKIYVIKIKKSKMSFVVTKNPSKYDFYINANFFADKPIGEVMINKKIINKKKSNGGYFVSDGKNFDFTLSQRPKNISYSSQTHLVGIKNGKLNNSIMYQKWSRSSAYRILLGKDKDGNFIAIHSNRYSPTSIKTICEIGIKEGMITGLVFDGGTSVDVSIKDGLYYHSFNVVPDFARNFNKDLKPPVYIAGNF